MENNKSSNTRVTGVFVTNEDADEIYDALLKRGYSRDEISVVMSDFTHTRNFQSVPKEGREKTHAVDDAGRGALIGGATGAIVSAIAAVGTNLAMPGLGLVFVGPLLAGLAGAAAGGIAGGTIGAIVGSGYPKEEADYYENSIKEGGVMISVSPKSAADRNLIAEDFKRHNGQKIYVDGSSIIVN